MAKEQSVVVIGCGGIWSYLWKPLGRMLAYTKGAPKKILLVDGDHFTPSNASRQDMVGADLMRNKASVYIERFKAEFPELSVSVKPEFVTKKNIETLIPEDAVVVSCVDNHATRRLIADRARSLRDAVVVTGASDEMNGNVHVQIVEKGKALSSGMDETHPEVANGKDRNPGDLSCEERARLPGGGQTLNGNLMTASIMSVMLWRILSEKAMPLSEVAAQNEVFYDLNHMAMEPAKGSGNVFA